ncbi:MAG: metallophosphoesterase [Parachlamydiaceae bacterium]
MLSKDHLLFDLFCCATIIGVWPRFIEPELLTVTKLKAALPGLKKPLKILQLSDLHFGPFASDRLVRKILQKTDELQPDLIVLTGDFLCYGKMHDRSKIASFLKALRASLGVYAILGNHDYLGGVTVDPEGNYAVSTPSSTVLKGISLLFKKVRLTGWVSPTAAKAQPHPELLELLKESGVELLVNRTISVEGLINLSGIAEYMTGQIDLDKTYKEYDPTLPGVMLAHNPDAISNILQGPSTLILSGHTHGGQINLPLFRGRFTLMEYPRYFSGLIREKGKTIYISRGLGSVMPFRFCAPPEIVLVELTNEVKNEN